MRIASERSGGREGSIDEAEVPLSARLRALTSTAHRALEARTGWPETLGGTGDVATMLRMLRALHASLDAAHACSKARSGSTVSSPDREALPR